MAVDLAMNGMVHRALGRELDRVHSSVESGDAVQARKHYAFFSEQLHLHHETEDQYLWDVARARTTDESEILTIDAMAGEHDQLHAALDLCDRDFAGVGPLPEDTSVHLNALQLLMSAHFAHEEAQGEQVLVAHLTPEDLKPFNEANKKSPNAMMVFPWIADGGTAADEKVYDVLPGPVRLFVKPMMQRKYRAFLA